MADVGRRLGRARPHEGGRRAVLVERRRGRPAAARDAREVRVDGAASWDAEGPVARVVPRGIRRRGGGLRARRAGRRVVEGPGAEARPGAAGGTARDAPALALAGATPTRRRRG